MRSDRRPSARAENFWAAPYERGGEYGGLGWPAVIPDTALALRIKGVEPQNTTIAIVATDADLTKAQAKRLAIMAQSGMSRALRPAHAAHDGDVISAPPPVAPAARRISTP